MDKTTAMRWNARMRIIAGEYRSRKLVGPPDGDVTRPIMDRAKQSLFDRLGVLGLPLEAQVLDIFAGVGSLGLECLSRGATGCVFLERSREILPYLERNIASLRVGKKARILSGDALAPGWSATLPAPPMLVFCDPPYAMMEEPASAARIGQLIADLTQRCEPMAVMVLRIPKFLPSPEYPGWAPPERYEFGSMAILIYERVSPKPAEPQASATAPQAAAGS